MYMFPQSICSASVLRRALCARNPMNLPNSTAKSSSFVRQQGLRALFPQSRSHASATATHRYSARLLSSFYTPSTSQTLSSASNSFFSTVTNTSSPSASESPSSLSPPLAAATAPTSPALASALSPDEGEWVSENSARYFYLLREIDLQGLVYKEVLPYFRSRVALQKLRYYRRSDIMDRVNVRFGGLEDLALEKERLYRKGVQLADADAVDVLDALSSGAAVGGGRPGSRARGARVDGRGSGSSTGGFQYQPPPIAAAVAKAMAVQQQQQQQQKKSESSTSSTPSSAAAFSSSSSSSESSSSSISSQLPWASQFFESSGLPQSQRDPLYWRLSGDTALPYASSPAARRHVPSSELREHQRGSTGVAVGVGLEGVGEDSAAALKHKLQPSSSTTPSSSSDPIEPSSFSSFSSSPSSSSPSAGEQQQAASPPPEPMMTPPLWDEDPFERLPPHVRAEFQRRLDAEELMQQRRRRARQQGSAASSEGVDDEFSLSSPVFISLDSVKKAFSKRWQLFMKLHNPFRLKSAQPSSSSSSSLSDRMTESGQRPMNTSGSAHQSKDAKYPDFADLDDDFFTDHFGAASSFSSTSASSSSSLSASTSSSSSSTSPNRPDLQSLLTGNPVENFRRLMKPVVSALAAAISNNVRFFFRFILGRSSSSSSSSPSSSSSSSRYSTSATKPFSQIDPRAAAEAVSAISSASQTPSDSSTSSDSSSSFVPSISPSSSSSSSTPSLSSSSTASNSSSDSHAHETPLGAWLARWVGGSNAALTVGLGGNIVIFAMKAVNALLTGSSTMLVEVFHSLIDALNQYWLKRTSSQMDQRQADALHPYGYAGALHLSVLMATLCALVCGSGFAVYSVHAALTGAHQVSDLYSSALLLMTCSAIESFTLFFAWRQCREEAARLGVSPAAYVFDSAADPRTLFILAEDASALLSCAVGAFCLLMAEWMALPIWDAVGTTCVAFILSMQFLFAWRRTIAAVNNPSVNAEFVRRVQDFILADHMVSSVHDIKATVLGPFAFRFKAEVNINGRALARGYMARHIDVQKVNIQDPEQLQQFWKKHGSSFAAYIADELARIEHKVKDQFPLVKHVDLKLF